jgi:hypothetical protein
MTDLVESADGKNTHALVSARSIVVDCGAAVDAELPVILKTTTHSGADDEGSELPWMPQARARFDSSVGRLATSRGTFWLWPSASGVLSDVPSTQTFFRARADQAFGLFLDPAALLTPAMIPKAEDHLARIFAALSGTAAAILLANIEPVGGVEGVQLSPLTRGVLSPKTIANLWREHAPESTPVVLLDEDFDQQLAFLGLEAH